MRTVKQVSVADKARLFHVDLACRVGIAAVKLRKVHSLMRHGVNAIATSTQYVLPVLAGGAGSRHHTGETQDADGKRLSLLSTLRGWCACITLRTTGQLTTKKVNNRIDCRIIKHQCRGHDNAFQLLAEQAAKFNGHETIQSLFHERRVVGDFVAQHRFHAASDDSQSLAFVDFNCGRCLPAGDFISWHRLGAQRHNPPLCCQA